MAWLNSSLNLRHPHLTNNLVKEKQITRLKPTQLEMLAEHTGRDTRAKSITYQKPEAVALHMSHFMTSWIASASWSLLSVWMCPCVVCVRENEICKDKRSFVSLL